MTEREIGHYEGLMDAACVIFEKHGPFWYPSRYRKAYREVLQEAQDYRAERMEESR